MKSKVKVLQFKSFEDLDKVQKFMGSKYNVHTYLGNSLIFFSQDNPGIAGESIIKDWWILKFANGNVKIISDHVYNRDYRKLVECE